MEFRDQNSSIGRAADFQEDDDAIVPPPNDLYSDEPTQVLVEFTHGLMFGMVDPNSQHQNGTWDTPVAIAFSEEDSAPSYEKWNEQIDSSQVMSYGVFRDFYSKQIVPSSTAWVKAAGDSVVANWDVSSTRHVAHDVPRKAITRLTERHSAARQNRWW